MKKIESPEEGRRTFMSKILLCMRLTVFLMLLSVFSSLANNSYSQNKKFNLDCKNMPIKQIIQELKNQSDVEFFYSNNDFDTSVKMDIIIKNGNLKDILDQIIIQANLKYKIIDNTVIISKDTNSLILPQPQKAIKGKITDTSGTPLPGVSIIEKGTTNGTITDSNGNYSIDAPSNATLIFSFVGMKKQEIFIAGKENVDVIMEEESEGLDEVVIVGYGKQKKTSLVSSITTIDAKDLKMTGSSNLTTALSGKIAGMISFQRSGEPGKDNAQFFIRGLGTFGAGKVDPLILIDGVESSSTDLARLQPDDISGFSVLKDATAAAVYGARGANGVILVNTKTGEEGKTKVNFRAEESISTNTRNFEFADNITYMKLANEAALTRDPLATIPYSQNKLDHTIAGDNPLLYPNNNWIDQLIKDYTVNKRYNINISGGTRKAKYYLAGTLNIDNGVLKENSLNDFSSNIKLRNYSVRSNVSLLLTPTTEAIVRVYGQFDDYHGPIGGGSDIFSSAISSNPVMFAAIYPSDLSPYTNHPMFGSAKIPGTSTLYTNPYANSLSGFSEYNTSTMNAQLELKQDLKFITPGLSVRAMAYTVRYSYFDVSRQCNPFYYTAIEDGDNIILKGLNDGGTTSIGPVGTEYLTYDEGDKTVNTTFYLEAAANYNRTFNKVHSVSGMLISLMKNYLNGNAGDLESSLPFRNAGISGRFTYAYDNRYLIEGNFGYNGSERFASNHRWGFFPSIGGGWVLSNEKFFSRFKNSVDNLKLRFSYGLVGNDQIGDTSDRFFYMSNVNLSDGSRGATFGRDYGYSRSGVSISRYSNTDITWEKSKQLNLGFDLYLFGSLNIVADIFKQHRTSILMSRSYVPSTMGLEADVAANTGEAESKGIDGSIDYHKAFGNNWWIQGRANFTYSTSKILAYDEPAYPMNEQYRSHIGHSTTQAWGYIAERLFIDEMEVANSPEQSFGDYMGGDIKYRDINKDGKITSADMVPLGYPTTPEISYGFGFTIGHGNFDASAFFQGSARSSFWIDPGSISPFVVDEGNQNGLLKEIANDHWSEDNRNSYAFWPRLSGYPIDNNNTTSTWWMRDGSFLRLKSVEIGYNLPQRFLNKYHIGNARLYVNGTNLFSISKFKMWDVEMGGDGIGYPIQRVFNIGLNIGI